MSKSKIILAAIGGVFGLALLAAAGFVWLAYSANSAAMEGNDDTAGLNPVLSQAESLMRKPVFPCAESLKAINSNCSALVEWREEAFKLVARGDRAFPKTTPAGLKEFIVGEAQRLAALPGAANGKIVKADFGFGPFQAYVGGGKIPEEGKLDQLQRQWDDITAIIEMLSTNGVSEVTAIELKGADQAAAAGEAKPTAKTAKNKAKSKKGKAKEARLEDSLISNTYAISFTASPTALVKTVNMLAAVERFMIIDSITFAPVADSIAEALGSVDKKKDAERQSARGRGRRNRKQQTEEAAKTKAEDENKEVAIDQSPFAVTIAVTVKDFKSLETEEQK